MIKISRSVAYPYISVAMDLKNWTNRYLEECGLHPIPMSRGIPTAPIETHDALFIDIIVQSVEYYLYCNSRWAPNNGKRVEDLQERLVEATKLFDPAQRRYYFQNLFDRHVIAPMEEVLGSFIAAEPYDIWDIKLNPRSGVMLITYDGDYRIRAYEKHKSKFEGWV